MPLTGRQADGTRSKKCYGYRSTFKHQLSRARNLARRNGMTKAATLKARGRLPKKNEWWGPEGSQKAWEKVYLCAVGKTESRK